MGENKYRCPNCYDSSGIEVVLTPCWGHCNEYSAMEWAHGAHVCQRCRASFYSLGGNLKIIEDDLKKDKNIENKI